MEKDGEEEKGMEEALQMMKKGNEVCKKKKSEKIISLQCEMSSQIYNLQTSEEERRNWQEEEFKTRIQRGSREKGKHFQET